eukprot:TRINITY_DN3889_c0_g1_i1.p1 TRINITY_DN3889_c0_g1~~TRINITY_DN3889_c0_g1_i1.p1  ORF type:complete len:124 (-),score=11.46 TRINITY_DN3889_c0_g1_i1:40-411(-)
MLRNSVASDDFEEFINFIADKIELQNWNRYNGGLDIKNNRTGTHSYFTTLDNNQIMFHVSTLLPLSEPDEDDSNDKASTVITKKVHIGNDIVCIIFNDGDSPFVPDCITSQFNRMLLLIHSSL